jgi:hypothetical protein
MVIYFVGDDKQLLVQGEDERVCRLHKGENGQVFKHPTQLNN